MIALWRSLDSQMHRDVARRNVNKGRRIRSEVAEP